jgi:GT2 family glycosyltransferase
MTDDDCTVDRSWVSTGWLLLNHHGWRLATGRVLDGDGGQATPSTTTHDAPVVYEDSRHCDVLFTGNAAMDRRTVLELGGFDEQFASAAEDNDLCYRWLQAGHALRYEPAMTVTHHGRREPGDLQALYVRYWRGQGRFYGKLVRRRDTNVLRFLARDGRDLMRAYAAGLLRPTPGRLDPRRAMVRGLPPGIVEGWRSRQSGQG